MDSGKTGWAAIAVIAHRCGGTLAPENSLAGLAEAHRAGLRAVEFDVMLSADGEPVVIHDETLERTTTGQGRVSAHTLRQLRQVHCGKGWPGAYAQEPIPTLDEVLVVCRQLRLLPNIEIKPATGDDAETGRVVADRARARWSAVGGDPQEVLFSSFSDVALREAARAAPEFARAWLTEHVPSDWHDRLQALGAQALHCRHGAVSPELLAATRALGVPVRCYTVNDRARALRLFRAGVSAVFTDELRAVFSDERPDSGEGSP